MYLEKQSPSLGVAPVVVQTGIQIASKVLPKLWGGGEKLTYPWRVRPVGGSGGIFEIVYGTQHKWFPVWTGKLETIFDPSGFDVSGNTNRGKWRAYVEGDTVKVIEFVNDKWYPVDSVTLSRLIEAYGYTPRLRKVMPAVRPETTTAPTVTASMFGGDGSMLPLLIGAGVAIALVFRK